MNSNFDFELQRMKDEIEIYPGPIRGEHRGIKWIMKRPHNTYWCGYISILITSDEIGDLLGDNSHYGITGSYNDRENGIIYNYGFDCAHGGDFAPISMDTQALSMSKIWYDRIGDNNTYKDYDYVYNIIKNMINAYLDNI